MTPRCYICGKNLAHCGSMWNGNTDRDYCYKCGQHHFFDDDAEASE